MRPTSFLQTATSWRSLLVAILLCNEAYAKKDAPHITISDFQHKPENLNYFVDSDVILFQDYNKNVVYRSSDAGQKWSIIDSVPTGEAWELVMHPYDNKRAYILTQENGHWKTSDRGESWKEFQAQVTPRPFRQPLSFHAGDPDKIIFNGQDCFDIFCAEMAYYTTDGFATAAEPLRQETRGCTWAKSADLFATGDNDLDADRILCVARGEYTFWPSDYRLLISDDYFKEHDGEIQEFEPELEPGRVVDGIVSVAVVKKYLVTAAQSKNTNEMALYVSDDTIKWHRGIFPHDHRVEEEAYTILESTNYSIQIDVQTSGPTNPMGVLFSSNSNGTYFTRNIEHTNRIYPEGLVDFEKMTGVQGIVFVNVVDNWEEVEKSSSVEKEIKSQISFDDGRTFSALMAGDKELHIHSVTDLENTGRVFSSPAPGLVMAVGNTGKKLKPLEDGDLFVSDDAGFSWVKAQDGPHKYEFGDQGSILVAVEEGMTDKIRYSLDHGQKWEKADLPKKMHPLQLTTTQDSTSLKFLLIGGDDRESSKEFYVVAIDFSEMHEDTCKEENMEKWYARLDEDGEPTCVMGHKQYYMRRKAGAECFVKKEFQDPVAKFEPCECTDQDFECDYNFVRSADRKECIQAGDLVVPEGACKGFDDKTTFKGSSGWRLIPGNECKRTKGDQKDDPVERKCSEAYGAPASGDVHHTDKEFDGSMFKQKMYLERVGSSSGDDETVVVWTEDDNARDTSVYLSHDHGKTWEVPEVLKDVDVQGVYQNQYFNDAVFFTTSYGEVYYSIDRGRNIRNFEAPSEMRPGGGQIFSFHPNNRDWLIWHGAKDCGGFLEEGTDCHTDAWLTTNRGDEWKLLQRYVEKCEFVEGTEFRKRDEKLIYCAVHEREDSKPNNPLQLVASDNFFVDKTVHFENIETFALMNEFIMVATKDDDNYLKVDASVDGTVFAEARFPPNFKADSEGYTVLDSSTHAVFLHVTEDSSADFAYGSIIKSNSNGTSYVLSINGVNRDAPGYVDFEKMYGLEGVALANIVDNLDAKQRSSGKKLKTMITHNDGAEWSYIPPPAEDSDGKKYSCTGSSLDKCSLHIHGYTERADKSHTYSTVSAIGLMMGTGNVGDHLNSGSKLSDDEVQTYITADAGLSWKEVKKGAYMWAYVDQGAVVAIVKQGEPTNTIYFSRDEGKTWTEYVFRNDKININDITTTPSANSRNLLLWGRASDQLITINVDFSGLTDRQCVLDESTENDDYYLWTPKHPKQDNDCLFGHVSQYHRKKTDADCYNGREIQHLHNIANNCTCTRQDFECDFNYQRLSDGTCALVEGLKPQDHSQICREDDSAVEYWDPTGYRKIPLSTCQGGREMEFTSSVHPCPGKEEDFYKKRRISGAGLFFAITLPIIAAGAFGYWAWKTWQSKFGQIRLGESASFDREAPYIKYPVMVVAGVVSIVQALPFLVMSLWRSAVSMFGGSSPRRFTTRSSFARPGEYAVVDEDEGELLGDESDEEV